MNDLEWTGERLVTSVKDGYFIFEHLHRYAIAQSLATNKTVLDIACGEGYGTWLISQTASFAYGVDIDNNAVNFAKAKYENRTTNIDFKQGSTSKIPLETASVDLVVSFETIEHHDEHEQMMIEIKRVLKPDGILLISSPNKLLYDKISPNNPFHVKELTFEEFELLINKHFKNAAFYEQRFVAGSLFTPLGSQASSFKTYDGDFEKVTASMQEESYYNQHYFSVAICKNTDSELPGVTSFFNGVKAVLGQNTFFYNKGRNDVMKSTSFKLGNWFVSRFAFLKRNKSN
jgi:ubiquinone/menaquinone biosynthesis C-methylase UbiE